jgi:hypothetical protein
MSEAGMWNFDCCCLLRGTDMHMKYFSLLRLYFMIKNKTKSGFNYFFFLFYHIILKVNFILVKVLPVLKISCRDSCVAVY